MRILQNSVARNKKAKTVLFCLQWLW